MVRLLRVSSSSVVLGLAVLLAFGGCGGGSSSSSTDLVSAVDVPIGQPDVLADDQVEPGPDESGPAPTEGLLAFVDAMGETGLSCTGSNECTKFTDVATTKPLKVLYTEDDQPVKGAKIQYTIEGDVGSRVSLEPGNGLVPTGADGSASVNLRIIDASTELRFSVKVEATGRRVEVQPLTFKVIVDPKGRPPLKVLPEYTGARVVRTVEVKVFRQDSANPDPLVECPALLGFVRNGNAMGMPSADLAPTEVTMGASAEFGVDSFVNLQEDGQQMYTVLAIGRASGVDLVVGCDDAHGLVKHLDSILVTVPMADLPPRLAGTYEVRSEFDLVTALPSNVGDVVDHIITFFRSPSEELLKLLCLIPNETMNDLCEYIFDSEDNLTVTGDIAVGIIDGIIRGLTADSVWGDVLSTGGDVGRILKELTFLSRITIETEPDAAGELGTASEEWSTVRYRWTLGIPGCAEDDDCGWNEFSFQAISLSVIEAEFTGRVNTVVEDGHEPGTLLTIDPHPVNIKYGALVNYIIKTIVLPMLAGDGTDGLPRIDEYDELIKSILAGRQCLQDEVSGGKSCCRTFAENLSGESEGTVSVNLVESACTALVQYGGAYLEDTLVDLDFATGTANAADAFLLGTKEPCVLYDSDGDLRIDAMGKADAKCAWDAILFLNVGDGVEVHVEADFIGTRQ